MAYIKDSVNRPLHQGDKLIVTSGAPAVYTLLDVVPATDPRLPKDAVLVTLQSTIRLVVKDGQRLEAFMRVLSVAEQGLTEGSDKKPEGDGAAEKSTTRLIS